MVRYWECYWAWQCEPIYCKLSQTVTTCSSLVNFTATLGLFHLQGLMQTAEYLLPPVHCMSPYNLLFAD